MSRTVLKGIARRTGIRFASKLPFAWLRRLVPRNLLVLAYHVVDDEPLPHVRNLYPFKTVKQFEADLVFLRRNFELPRWEDVQRIEQPQQKRDRLSVLITVDDGMSQCFRVVRPLLLKYGIPCLFFITKSFIDNQRMFYRHKASLCVDRIKQVDQIERSTLLAAISAEFNLKKTLGSDDFVTWLLRLKIADEPTIDRVCEICAIDIDHELAVCRPYLTIAEIKQLHADGFAIGGHSVTHPRFSDLEDGDIEREIVDSCDFVRSTVGSPEVPFAFPYSADGIDRDLIRSIQDRNPWISTMFGTGGVELDEPRIVNRIVTDTPSSGLTVRSNLLPTIKARYADCLAQWQQTNTGMSRHSHFGRQRDGLQK